ncbi:beta-glucan synthesis-associated protein [Saccharomycopsis crataegensis]|uniref:Beta-glucan synthesis-associated protein n=1 Tax=Saccharomycopsis crataegensis TaxID=43959 RepID=A0AAV5QIN2_9ASCO|nr:beta-glucan synthesis-associated protein [Saccharomycopsis crataegensis]
MSRRNLTSGSPNSLDEESNPFNDQRSYSDSESDSDFNRTGHHNTNNNNNNSSSSNNNDAQMNNVNNPANDIMASSANNASKPYIDYSGFYSQQNSNSNINSVNNSVSNIQNPASNQNNVNNNIANTPISPNTPSNPHESLIPHEFDRYPSLSNGGNQRVASMAFSINSRNSLLGGPGANAHNKSSDMSDTSSMSDRSTNPFLIDADFSPFGGYPASSFPLHIDEKEPDDYLHNPDPIEDAKYDHGRMMFDLKTMDKRSGFGLVGLVCLLIGAIMVFVVYPVLTYSGILDKSAPVTYEILTKYTYPQLSAIRTSLVDPDTPNSALTKTARDGSKWNLAFSDEFNKEGRTFYDGDDQFFLAPDFHYAATNDLEWYDPYASSTANGSLNLRMDAYKNHDLFYRSGMVQTWNRLCFTQGNLEVGVMLPNYGNVTGLWPGIWTMGNIARTGYLATSDGVWPYSYEECDAGITPNQSSPDGISYLPGQRLNSCTCKGEDHPNRGTGRGAPEIDALEGEMDTTLGVGVASQSLQMAPYDIWYYPDYDFVEIHNSSISSMNTYTGGPFQQAVSATSTMNITWYEFGDTGGVHQFQKIGFEYLNDNDDGYIQWFIGDDPTLTIHAKALHPNGNIGWRRITKEPMSINLNLGISNNWAYIDWASLHFPMTMRIDYVRIYQPEGEENMGCDPEDYPTYDYIQDHLNAYSNPNLTSWEDAGYSFPKNKLTGGCT